MGKIRVKTLGDEDLEKEQKKEARLDREARQAKKRQEAKKIAKVESVEEPKREATGSSSNGDSPESSSGHDSSEVEQIAKREAKKHKTSKSPKTHKSYRSKKYQVVAKMIDKNKLYKLNEALEILPNVHIAKFDETVELHINTIEKGISGNLNLPHGTGKKVRVAIATDELIAELEKSLPATPSQAARASGLRGRQGKIDFDILLAEPSMMPKLAKVARILGPRGLMPNPKNGTISGNPAAAAKKFEGGQTNFKTEAKNPIIHLAVGKLSFGKKSLEENIKATINAIQAGKIRKAVLKSTMSPGIKIDFSSL